MLEAGMTVGRTVRELLGWPHRDGDARRQDSKIPCAAGRNELEKTSSFEHRALEG